MKISRKSSILVCLAASGGPLWAQNGAAVHGDPFTPFGSLRVTPTVVQPGVQPEMDWSIIYPKQVSDLALITPAGRLALTDAADLKVRVVGVAFDSNGAELPIALWVRVGEGRPWEMVFYGTSTDVQPDVYVLARDNVRAGATIDFAARGRSPDGSWYSTRWTVTNGVTVSSVTNGDPVSSISPGLGPSEAESFMTQFIDRDENVALGPRDVMHTFELASSDPGDAHFDMQDLVVITTLSGPKLNNGHGNNGDEVDSIKKQEGKLHDNKGDDPSGTLDDENKLLSGRKIKGLTPTTTPDPIDAPEPTP